MLIVKYQPDILVKDFIYSFAKEQVISNNNWGPRKNFFIAHQDSILHKYCMKGSANI